jgi:hypothetical protein
MTVGVIVEVLLRGASNSSFIYKGRDYKEGNWVNYNMILIRTLSLLVYFTYIFIDIIFYVLGSTHWSSGIFWMVGRVVTDPSLGLLSPCEVVPRVLILIISHRGIDPNLEKVSAITKIKPPENLHDV